MYSCQKIYIKSKYSCCVTEIFLLRICKSLHLSLSFYLSLSEMIHRSIVLHVQTPDKEFFTFDEKVSSRSLEIEFATIKVWKYECFEWNFQFGWLLKFYYDTKSVTWMKISKGRGFSLTFSRNEAFQPSQLSPPVSVLTSDLFRCPTVPSCVLSNFFLVFFVVL